MQLSHSHVAEFDYFILMEELDREEEPVEEEQGFNRLPLIIALIAGNGWAVPCLCFCMDVAADA